MPFFVPIVSLSIDLSCSAICATFLGDKLKLDFRVLEATSLALSVEVCYAEGKHTQGDDSSCCTLIGTTPLTAF